MPPMGNNSIPLEGLSLGGTSMRLLIALMIVVLSYVNGQEAHAKQGVMYLNKMYGSVHQNPSRSSTSLTVLACGHPVKVLSSQGQSHQSWKKVKAGLHTGFIASYFLQKERPNCFQDKYPRFYDSLKLSVTEFYFWARLYDNYIINKTTPGGK